MGTNLALVPQPVEKGHLRVVFFDRLKHKMCPLARAHFVLFCFFLSGCVQQLPLKFPGRRIQRTVPVVDQAY